MLYTCLICAAWLKYMCSMYAVYMPNICSVVVTCVACVLYTCLMCAAWLKYVCGTHVSCTSHVLVCSTLGAGTNYSVICDDLYLYTVRCTPIVLHVIHFICCMYAVYMPNMCSVYAAL